jgi:lysozyme
MNPIPEQHRQKAAWLVICTSLCAGAEGVRQSAYRDVTGIPTICFGETRDVKITDRKTLAECNAMLEGRLQEFANGVDRCVKVDLPPSRKAGMVDFAYNEGTGAFCKYIAPDLNAGNTQKACDHLLHFTTAGGVTFPGLVTRRQNERKLCMEGLT